MVLYRDHWRGGPTYQVSSGSYKHIDNIKVTCLKLQVHILPSSMAAQKIIKLKMYALLYVERLLSIAFC